MTWFKNNFPDKKVRIRILILLFILCLVFLFYYKKPQNIVILKVNDCLFKAELATNVIEKYQGLSDRDSLCQDCAMLFLYDKKEELSYVMRNMNFPLDIIFIADKKVLNIHSNTKPEGKQPKNLYSSIGKADAVLEINANIARKCNLKPGDLITWSQ